MPSWKVLLAYTVCSLALDAVSNPQTVLPLALAPWTPPPGVTLGFLILYGLYYAPWLVLVTLASALPLHGAPDSWGDAILAAVSLTLVLALAARFLRDRLNLHSPLESQRELLWLLGAVVVCTLLDALIHLIPEAWDGHRGGVQALMDMANFGIGALLRLLVVTPLVLVLARDPSLWQLDRERALQALSIVFILWFIFGLEYTDPYKFFYLLFLPLVWIAMRHGVGGAALGLALTLVGLNLTLEWQGLRGVTVAEFHMLMLGLALSGLTLGVTVSERRAVEARLNAREADFNQALRLAAASEMTQAMAHELNQPLAAAANYARAGRAALEQGGEPRVLREVLDKIERETSRAGQVVRRLREFYRGGGLHLEPLAVSELLDDALAPSRRRAQRGRSALKVRVDEGLPPLRADRIQAATVLHNLVFNALDSLGDQGGTVEVRVRRDADMARIEVSDDGPGVAPDLAETLFDSFVTSKPEGMGLGLAISRTLAEAHGGRLWLERARPACFCFTLPLEVS